MNQRTARAIVFLFTSVALTLVVATILFVPSLFTLENFDEGWSFFTVGIPFVVVGAILGLRRPSNPMGWLFQGWGLVMIFTCFTYAYTLLGRRPGDNWLRWGTEVIWHPAFALLVFILLLFPHGRLPSPGWKKFAYTVPATYTALATAIAVSPGAWELYNPDLDPPFRMFGGEVADTIFWALLYGQLLLVATAMASLIVKLRRSNGKERQQIKWFVFAVAAAVIVFIGGIIVLGAGYLFPVLASIPVMAGLAIMRYRLYDIDRIVSRTVAYTVVVGLLAAVFFGSVALMSSLLPAQSNLAVAASTLAVAALFDPTRRRIQRSVDRRFNRSRYNRQLVADAFNESIRDEVDSGRIVTGWVDVVSETMQPAAVGVWIRQDT